MSSRQSYSIRVLETPEELAQVEDLERLVWPGDDAETVPRHMMLAVAHNGGLVLGAYTTSGEEILAGFTFGFLGIIQTPDGPFLKHCSHMLGVHPAYRDQGLGFLLKRAQWQLVRRQGVDLITWTYDPLLSRNAHLNIQRLGAVCNTYLLDEYGEMRDALNEGLPSDRFQVDWWVKSQRVERRLSKYPRPGLGLEHFRAAEIPVLNPGHMRTNGLIEPMEMSALALDPDRQPIVMVEIPADFHELKEKDPVLGPAWRMHTRALFTDLFRQGYWVTDFVYQAGSSPHSFYVLTYGYSTLLGTIRKGAKDS